MGFEKLFDCPVCDAGGFCFRIAVNAGRDGGKDDVAAAQIPGCLQRVAIGGCQQICTLLTAAAVDRADGVNEIAGGEVSGGGGDRFACR